MGMLTEATKRQASVSKGIPEVRLRNAANTRNLLVVVARKRFARHGYTATTVREIAADAGVNVALINRYFSSKEGLFEACLNQAAQVIDDPNEGASTIDEIIEVMLQRIVNPPTNEIPLQLLLQQSSGDKIADQIRNRALSNHADRLALAAGWKLSGAEGEEARLRAQLALSMALGVVSLRSSMGLQPLTTASAEELSQPLREVFSVLLQNKG